MTSPSPVLPRTPRTSQPGLPVHRLLVTGPRNWPRTRAGDVLNALQAATQSLPAAARLVVVHGGCRTGVDAIAHAWCDSTPCLAQVFVVEEIHRACWRQQRRDAGQLRNQRMITFGASECFAFLMQCTLDCERPRPHWTHGTGDCLTRAEDAKIPVTRFLF